MKQNRIHYTWNTKPSVNNCFNCVLTGYKPKQKASMLLLLGIAALLSKLKLGGGA
jgi:hypothetical protein